MAASRMRRATTARTSGEKKRSVAALHSSSSAAETAAESLSAARAEALAHLGQHLLQRAAVGHPAAELRLRVELERERRRRRRVVGGDLRLQVGERVGGRRLRRGLDEIAAPVQAEGEDVARVAAFCARASATRARAHASGTATGAMP